MPGFVARINANITTTTDAASAVGDADVVLEAIVEHLSAKRSLFARLDALAPRDTIFASNTSGLLISDIAAAVSPQRRARFGGLHFFNPVPVMRLVEVPRPAELDEGVFRKLFELAQRLGKTPVSCADTPGFIVNRLNVPYKLEVVRMLERGDATPEDIDTAMRLGAGYPMGPLELFDLTGVDTTHYLTLGWKEYAARGLLPEELVRPTKMMADMVERGELGRKTGRGFYSVRLASSSLGLSCLARSALTPSTHRVRRRAGHSPDTHARSVSQPASHNAPTAHRLLLRPTHGPPDACETHPPVLCECPVKSAPHVIKCVELCSMQGKNKRFLTRRMMYGGLVSMEARRGACGAGGHARSCMWH